MYLNPSYGGMLIQAIVVLVAAGGTMLFAMRKKIRAFFNKDGKTGESSGLLITTAESVDIAEDDLIEMLSDEQE